MGKAKGVSRRKKKRYNYNVNRKKLHKKLHKMPFIECPQIRQAWVKGKSVRENLRNMGLASNSNEIIPVPKTKDFLEPVPTDGKKQKKDTPITEPSSSSDVVKELEQEASAPRETGLHLSSEWVKFCVYMLEKYGDDYEGMSRDPKNYYQESPGQIKKKIKKFKSVPVHWRAYQRAKGLLQDDADDECCASNPQS